MRALFLIFILLRTGSCASQRISLDPPLNSSTHSPRFTRKPGQISFGLYMISLTSILGLKFKGLDLFLLLLTTEACHLPCERQNLEYSDNGIPHPKLQVFAQSLLDINNLTDLEDLIDEMNLTPEWGDEFLDLKGCID